MKQLFLILIVGLWFGSAIYEIGIGIISSIQRDKIKHRAKQ